MKKVLIGFVAILAAVTMASSAFAASSIGIAATKVAAEVIPGATDFAVNTFSVAYQTGALIASGSTLTVTATGGKFASGSTMSLCEGGTERATAAAITSAGTTFTMTVGAAALPAAGLYSLSTTSGCGAQTIANPKFVVNAGTAAGNSVTLSVSNDSVSGDVVTGTVANVINQFAATPDVINAKLDFATSMKSFVASTSTVAPMATANAGGGAFAGLTLVTDTTIPVGHRVANAITSTTCGALTNAGDTVTVKISGDLNGFSKFNYTQQDATEVVNIAIGATEVTNGNVTLTIPGNNLRVCGSASVANAEYGLGLVSKNPGTTIAAGNRTIEVKVVPVTTNNGYNRTLVAAGTTSHAITLNATQAVVPYLATYSVMPTYCLINNSFTSAAAVTLDVLSQEGGGVLQSGLALGSVPAGQSMLMVFSERKAWLGDESKQSVTKFDLTVPASTRYAGRMNINAPPANLTINCVQVDPNANAGKRLVPVCLP